jgi:WD40 repeat protein
MGLAHVGVTISPDSRRVSYADNKQLVLKAIAADDSAKDVVVPLGNCWSVAWHPAVPVLAVARPSSPEQHNWQIVLWDWQHNAEALRWETESASPPRLALRPDGRMLAVRTADGNIRLYSTADGRERLVIEAVADDFPVLRWTADSRLVSGGKDDDLTVWQVSADPWLEERYRVPRPAEALDFSGDGRWAAIGYTAAGKSQIRLIDRRADQFRTREGIGGPLLFSPDSRRVVQRSATAVIVCDPTSGEVVHQYDSGMDKEGNALKWGSLGFSSDGKLLVVRPRGQPPELAVGNLSDDREEAWFVATPLPPESLDVPLLAPRGRWLVYMAKTGCRVWELPGHRLAAEQKIAADDEGASPSLISTNGRWLLAYHAPLDDNNAFVYSRGSWRVWALPGLTEALRWPSSTSAEARAAIDFSPDGRLAARSTPGGFVELWDLESRYQLIRWQPSPGRLIGQLTFTPEGWVGTALDKSGDVQILKLDAAHKLLEPLGLGW